MKKIWYLVFMLLMCMFCSCETKADAKYFLCGKDIGAFDGKKIISLNPDSGKISELVLPNKPIILTKGKFTRNNTFEEDYDAETMQFSSEDIDEIYAVLFELESKEITLYCKIQSKAIEIKYNKELNMYCFSSLDEIPENIGKFFPINGTYLKNDKINDMFDEDNPFNDDIDLPKDYDFVVEIGNWEYGVFSKNSLTGYHSDGKKTTYELPEILDEEDVIGIPWEPFTFNDGVYLYYTKNGKIKIYDAIKKEITKELSFPKEFKNLPKRQHKKTTTTKIASNTKSLKDLVRYLNGYMDHKFAKTSIELGAAEEGGVVKIGSNTVVIYKYDIDDIGSKKILEDIKKNHTMKYCFFETPAIVNGAFVITDYTSHPQKKEILKAFSDF